MKLYKAVNAACGDLPEGYYANIHIENGAGYIELFDSDGNEIHFEAADLNIVDQVDEAVFTAKAADNMKKQGRPKKPLTEQGL